MKKQLIKDLLTHQIKGENIRENEHMAKHTTFKVGGPVTFFVSPESVDELIHALRVCKENGIPYYIIGNGSNLLVPDEGIEGVVIEIFKNMADIKVKEETVTAGAGALLSRIAKVALDEALTGFEFAHGIPGTLGGAVTMNAGAYGGEMKDVLLEATVIDKEGNIQKLTNEALELGYRHSIISEKGYIVIEATLKLKKGDKEAIQGVMSDYMNRRRTKQPLEFPSAGSTFKRPEGYFAGKLIMDSNLAGYQIGGAQVSSKHCGFIINVGGATCKDILDLIEYVQEQVKEQFGVALETEVRLLSK